MKLKMVFSAALLGVLLSANAQFRKIPGEVTDAFKEKYSNASQVSWKDNITSFQASFKIGNDNLKAYYNSKGEWQKTEKTYTPDALPRDVKDGFKKSKYAGWEVKDILYVEEKDKQPQYRMQVRKSDLQKKNLYFSTSGQLLDDSITL